MANQRFLCLALNCINEVERHAYNFGTGFCDSCQNTYHEKTSELLTKIDNP